MVNIRTITLFGDPGCPIDRARLAEAGLSVGAVKAACQQSGYTVQTTRFASRPFPELVPASGTVAFACDLQARSLANGFDYVTIGPARPGDLPEAFQVIPEVISTTTAAFASAVTTTPEGHVDMAAVRLTAEIVHRIARANTDGFGNLRFAALANVPAGVPFLPAAYHHGGKPTVGLGIEGATLAVQACADAGSLDDARARLIRLVEEDAIRLSGLVERALSGTGVVFGGIDFSLAQFPDPARSIGTAIERLMGGRAGEAGTLAAAAWLADTLDRARFPRAGFSGLFLPVFEDAVLAERAAQGLVTTSDLLLYSTVCGTGLDTVPLPGNITTDALAGILMDVAALALRLNKPLTARLMPIPGKFAGDGVTFDFPFFAPTRVLEPKASGIGGLLGAASMINYRPRPR